MDVTPSPSMGPPPAEEALDSLAAILDEIRSARSRSRAELVARTGLSRGIVSQRVNELIGVGLVVEGPFG
ncbi:MAG: MarR family transcriptional regulator, partial [Chloroflexota bacterium]|nr:MarR family transcriptional regulator [Chloroflexota bacterium]